MSKPTGKDLPLKVKIEGKQLVMRIGIDTLAFWIEHCPRFYDDETNPDPPFCKVTDKMEAAKDVLRALCSEREDGSGPLSDFLDDAIVAASEDGSIGFVFKGEE